MVSRLLCLIIVSITFIPNAFSNEKIEKILEFSGTVVQIDNLPDDVKSSLDSILKSIKDVEVRNRQMEINSALHISLQKKVSIKDLNGLMENNFTENEINELYNWYNSGIAKKITSLEVLEQERGLVGLGEYATKLKTEIPSDERRKYIDSIINETNSVQSAVEVTKVILVGILIREIEGSNHEQKISFSELMQKCDLLAISQKHQLLEVITVQFFRMYESLTISELLKYNDFLKTMTGKKFIRIISDKLSRDIRLAAEDFSKK